MKKQKLKKAIRSFIKSYESELASYYKKGVESSSVELARQVIDCAIRSIDSAIESL